MVDPSSWAGDEPHGLVRDIGDEDAGTGEVAVAHAGHVGVVARGVVPATVVQYCSARGSSTGHTGGGSSRSRRILSGPWGSQGWTPAGSLASLEQLTL